MGARHKSPKVTLGELLNGWRTKSGLTQKQAADSAGVNQGTWSRWERGELMPGADDLNRILDAAKGDLTASVLVEAAVRKAS